MYWAGEDFVSVAHVHIEHVKARIGPNDWTIAARDRVFKSDGVVLRIEGKKDFYIFAQARTRFPDVPLIGRSSKCGGKVLRNRVCTVINDQFSRQRRPVVAKKDGTAEKIDEPGPVGALVVVSGDVETKPCTAVGHIVLKGFTLFGRVRKIVEPDDELDVFKLVGIHVVPVRRGSQREIAFLREVTIKAHRLQSEVDMVLFPFVSVEGDNVEWWVLGRPLWGSNRWKEDYGETNYKSAKSGGPLPSELSNVATSLRSRRSETRKGHLRTSPKHCNNPLFAFLSKMARTYL